MEPDGDPYPSPSPRPRQPRFPRLRGVPKPSAPWGPPPGLGNLGWWRPAVGSCTFARDFGTFARDFGVFTRDSGRPGSGQGEGPANEYESLDGPFCFGRRGGCQADNSLSRPAPHPPCGSSDRSPQCLSFCRVAPLFPCGICVRDLYPRCERLRKQIEQITSMEFGAVFVHHVEPVVHRLSTDHAQGCTQPRVEAYGPPRSSREGRRRESAGADRERSPGMRKGPRASMSRSTGPSR